MEYMRISGIGPSSVNFNKQSTVKDWMGNKQTKFIDFKHGKWYNI